MYSSLLSVVMTLKELKRDLATVDKELAKYKAQVMKLAYCLSTPYCFKFTYT